jgi:hypothetical protein
MEFIKSHGNSRSHSEVFPKGKDKNTRQQKVLVDSTLQN